MKQKTWCVHLCRSYKYEDVLAKNAGDAGDKARQQFLAENAKVYDHDISHIEMMRQCKCGQDNDPDNRKCEGCGAKL